MLRSVREDPGVTRALQSAVRVYPRVWDAFDSLCWMLARRALAGATIESNELYHIHKQAGGVFGVPSLLVIYKIEDETISILSIKVG
jgi:hypothetical protein